MCRRGPDSARKPPVVAKKATAWSGTGSTVPSGSATVAATTGSHRGRVRAWASPAAGLRTACQASTSAAATAPGIKMVSALRGMPSEPSTGHSTRPKPSDVSTTDRQAASTDRV